MTTSPHRLPNRQNANLTTAINTIVEYPSTTVFATIATVMSTADTAATTVNTDAALIQFISLYVELLSQSLLATTFKLTINVSEADLTLDFITKYSVSLFDIDETASEFTNFAVYTSPELEFVMETPSSRSYYVAVSLLYDISGTEEWEPVCWIPNMEWTGNLSSLKACPVVQTTQFSITEEELLEAVLEYNFSSPQSAGSLIFLSALDALTTKNTTIHGQHGLNNNILMLYDVFLVSISNVSTTNLQLSQEIFVLSNFLEMSVNSIGLNLDLLSGIEAIVEHFEEAVNYTDYNTEVAMLELIDNYVEVRQEENDSNITTLSMLDSLLNGVCLNGNTEFFSGDCLNLTCMEFTIKKDQSVAILKTGKSTIYIHADSLNAAGQSGTNSTIGNNSLMISLSTWFTRANSVYTEVAANASYISNIQGIALATDPVLNQRRSLTADKALEFEVNSIDKGFQIVTDLVNVVGKDSIRKSMLCSYWSEDSDEWSEQGVHLRGVVVSSYNTANTSVSVLPFQVTGICVSSHLTLFTVTDAAAAKFNDKLDKLSDRWKKLKGVNLLDDSTNINFLVPFIFCFVTLVFAIVIIIVQRRGRKRAKREARHVFVHDGELVRPTAIRDVELEAILRGWLPLTKLLILEVFSRNIFFAMSFKWSGERIMFSRADKATIFFASCLSTFIVQALVFDDADPIENNNHSLSSEQSVPEQSFEENLLDIFFYSLITNLVVFPVKFFFPRMVAAVNQFRTSTEPFPSTVLERQWTRFKQRATCTNKQSISMKQSNAEIKRQREWIRTWKKHEVSIESDREEDPKKSLHRISRSLKFLNCKISLPVSHAFKESQLSEQEIQEMQDHLSSVYGSFFSKEMFMHSQREMKQEKAIMRFQLHIRKCQQRRYKLRMIGRLILNEKLQQLLNII